MFPAKLPLVSVPPKIEPRLELIEKSPEGAPVPEVGFTTTFTGIGCPCCTTIGVGLAESLVVVCALEIVPQLFSKFSAFTEPRPVAMSYPGPALNPVWPGTLLFPTVVSKKLQLFEFLGFSRWLELQAESLSAAASLYRL